jgi:dihydropteroate synthase
MSNSVSLGTKEHDLDKGPLLMGVLNVTPDSFSDGGQYNSPELAFSQAMKLIEDGADILDIGGESTRPGSAAVSIEEELQRVVPVIKLIRNKSDIPISIDTRKAAVADAAVNAGANILNDISGLKHDPQMLNVLQQYKLPVIIMHIKGTPETMQQNPVYDDLIGEIRTFLVSQAEKAVEAGSKQVFIDPGIGFGKTTKHNLSLIKHLAAFRETGFPIVLGPSRKRFIGNLLDLPVHDRLEGTLAVAAVGVYNGADILRLHDIKAGRRAIDMAHHLRQAE